MVLADTNGSVHTFKVPSVPADPSAGVLRVLQSAADFYDVTLNALLGACNLFVHGSTIATNTMLEGKGATVGLLTSRGFRDSLEIRRGYRENQWDHRRPFPPVLVPRYLRLPVGGRIDRNGDEIEPFVPADVEAAIRQFREEGVEAIAVALINGFLNPVHEQACAEIIRDQWDGDPDLVSLSSEIIPIMGEYERTSTTVVNAYLGPRVSPYLKELNTRLADLGLKRPFLLVQSNGGMTSVDRIATRPVNLLLSGPAAGVGALNACRTASGTENLISMEIGGTSCDVMLMGRGAISVHDELKVAGYHVAAPAADIHTVGAGGGTLAGVDDGGMLFVGPRGAGADPGPACYGHGGSEPTVTDAQLVLGRLRPGPYADGSVSLDRDLAEAAIKRAVADPLGLSVEDAAVGIIRVVEQHLLLAVQRISIERGHDPREFTLVAAGGAGPMHGAAVGRALECARVYIPRYSGVFCALGMLYTDVRHDITRVLLSTIDEANPDDIVAGFKRLEDEARLMLADEGFDNETVALARELDLSYRGQQWVVRVPVRADGEEDPAEVRAKFEGEYERLYGHTQPDGIIEISNQRVVGTGALPTLNLGSPQAAANVPQPIERRSVFLGQEWGWREIPVFAGADLLPGHIIDGPLMVEERTTTVFVGPNDRLEIDATDNLLIDGLQEPLTSAAAEEKMADDTIDPVTLALIQNRFDDIARHMGWVMMRTARNPFFSDCHDFACFLTDAKAELISQSDGIPIQAGCGGFIVEAVLKAFAGEIEEGDVFLANDPYQAGGNHLPDWVIIRPVFVEGVLIAFSCNRAHQSDIGGGTAGSYNAGATEIWHEGIRLPPLKLVSRGEIRDDLWNLLMLNTRTPRLVDGDLRAMLGSTRIGAERVAALVEEFGVAAGRRYIEALLDYGERMFRAAIRDLPDGRYEAEEMSHNDCFEDIEIPIRMTMTIEGDHVTADFTGTHPQVKGFKNSSFVNTHACVYLGLFSFLDPSLPRNGGAFRAVTLIAPQGTIVNPRPPAPLTQSTQSVGHEIVHVTWKALAQADPAHACAGWGKGIHGVTAGRMGTDDPYVMIHWCTMPGAGAVDGRDGFDQLGHVITLGGLLLHNVEPYEQRYPMRFIRQEYRCDTGGPGEFRGGTGINYGVAVEEQASYSFRGEGLVYPSGFGVNGGGTGREAEMEIVPAAGDPEVTPPYGNRTYGAAQLNARSSGGGGWGDPLARDPAKVLRDARNGLISREGARRDYGVVLTEDGKAVDAAATEAERARL